MSPTPGRTWSTSLHVPRPLILDNLSPTPRTFTEALCAAVESNPGRVQYISAKGQTYTVSEFYTLSRAIAKALLAIDLKPMDGVAIMGFNAVEWFAADVGTTLAGGIPAGIYTTNKKEIVAYILKHSNAKAVFVDNDEMLEKVMSVKDECTSVKKIVVWGDNVKCEGKEGVCTWQQFLAIGENIQDAHVDARMNAAKPEHVAKLIYTSGTTGPPKAVMISHDNITFTVEILSRIIDIGEGDRMVSYLPSSHIASNVVDICGGLVLGPTVTLADPDALKGSLVKTLKKVKPTVFLGVPRVFEKIQEKLLSIGASNGALKRALTTWAKSIGTQASKERQTHDDPIMPWGYELANKFVFSKVRQALGLDKCRLLFNAAAPLQAATVQYFNSLNFEILDVYGMSEATGPVTSNFPEFRFGTSGKLVPGLQHKILNKDANGEGELCYKGRNVFVGYLNNEEETKKALDHEGYMHSGDLCKIDADGFVTITGRVKELIVTAGGENVAPALVEQSLISAMPAISRAFAIGDKRKFISCFVIPYIDERGELIGPSAAVNDAVKTSEDASKDEVWKKYVDDGIKRANEHAISNAARVRKFTILTKDFSVESGELTPTMKVKRKVVLRNFQAEADGMYDL